jgi:hypothetical protein
VPYSFRSLLLKSLFLPAFPFNFCAPNSANNANFEYPWAPLSFFWLARCLNLSGNAKNTEEIIPRIRHLSRLYEFPDDMFKKSLISVIEKYRLVPTRS